MEKFNDYFRSVVNYGSESSMEDQNKSVMCSPGKDEPPIVIPPTK